MEQFFRYLAIVKWIRRRSDGLIGFMSFTGNQDRISFFCAGQSETNRFTSIDFDSILGPFHPLFDLFDDGVRIFTTRVIRSDDGVVASLKCGLSHQWPLCLITFPAAA